MNLFGYLEEISSLKFDCQFLINSLKRSNLRLQEFFPMAREKDITKPVNFEQISVKAVPPESSDRELSVVLDVGDLLRVAQVYQTSLCHLEAKIFILKVTDH